MIRFLFLFRLLLVLPASAAVFAACGAPMPLDGLPKGEAGRVVRIIDGDALVLDTGLVVRLAGIEAPTPERRNRSGQPYAAEAARTLEDLALGRDVTLYYPGLTRDRYDRALAYAVTSDNLGDRLWLNEALVRRGAARVRVYPDTAALAERLLEAEYFARLEVVGLWAETDYEIRAASELPEDEQGFNIIRIDGLRSADVRDASRHSCAFVGLDSAFFIDVGPAAAGICAEPPETALVRGYVKDGRIELTHSLNLQVLSP
ncbi:MAG: thermonuclease family protein [Pseudomonadota bacterium]